MIRKRLFIPISILIVLAGLWWLYGEYTAMSSIAHELERQETVAFLQKNAAPYIASGALQSSDPTIQRDAFASFFKDVQSPTLFRIKVWSKDKVILWSDLEDIIGRQYADNKEVARAFEGTPVISIGQPKLEHVSERQLVQLLEVYAPMYDESGNIFVVIETYTVGADISSEISQSLLVKVLLTLLAIVVLIGIARVLLRGAPSSNAARL